MPNFNDFVEILKNDLLDFAKENLQEYKDELIRDGNSFVEKTKTDLERWTQGLEAGALNQEDFEFLLKAKKDLAEMEALKLAGLAQVKIDKITNGIFDVIAGSAIKTFL